MQIILFFPLLAILLIAYNVIIFANGEAFSVGAPALLSMQMISGANWTLTTSDIFIILGVCFLYIELFKATRTSNTSILDHGLSTLVFIIFLVEFLLVKGAGTSTFLILMLMSLLDVIAGFTISITGARHDFQH